MKNQERKELTYAQKLALDGEIAYAIATSNHDDEVLYRMYSVLATIPKDLYNFVLDAFERLSDISQEKIDRVRAELALGKVPLWIWENTPFPRPTSYIDTSVLSSATQILPTNLSSRS